MSHALGWVPFEDRSVQQMAEHYRIVGAMPRLAIAGPSEDKGQKVLLTDFWCHPDVVSTVGFSFPGIHQLTGSCVGAGGGNAVFTLSAVEVVRLGDPEQALVPFWLYTYGKSRQRSGMRGRGEGSTGSGYAEAIRLDGILAQTQALAGYQQRDGLVWGESAEYQWSAGEAAPADVAAEAKKHPVRSTAQCRSADDVRAAILNYYPCTDACSLFASPNGASVRDGVSLARLDSRGGHQTSIQGYYDHPSLGELFLYVNQWGGVYPQDPAGAPRCAAWITRSDMERICSEGEVYAFSQFDGFPGQPKLLHHLI